MLARASKQSAKTTTTNITATAAAAKEAEIPVVTCLDKGITLASSEQQSANTQTGESPEQSTLHVACIRGLSSTTRDAIESSAWTNPLRRRPLETTLCHRYNPIRGKGLLSWKLCVGLFPLTSDREVKGVVSTRFQSHLAFTATNMR